MVRVYKVSNASGKSARLHLPDSAWAKTVQERLPGLGWSVQLTDEPQHPDTRGAEEIALVAYLLDLADPV